MSRIAFVGYSYGVDPRLIGGHQSILRRLATFLTGHGHDVDFVLFGEPSHQSIDLSPGVTLLTFPMFADAARHLVKQRYDYVQLSYLPAATYPAATRYLAWQRQQAVRPRMGYLYVVWPPRATMRMARIIMFKLFYDRVVAVSPRLDRELKRHRIDSFLMLPPVPDQYFEVTSRPASAPRVGYIGRIGADKGVQHVVEILRELRARHPSLQAEIAGHTHPHSPESVNLHRSLIAQDVIHYEGGSFERFEPALESSVLSRLTRTDLLLLPYQHLSGITVDVPLLLLEAMAAGCAVLTTNVSDIPEIVAQPSLVLPTVSLMLASASGLIERGELALVGAALRKRAEALGVRLSVSGARYEREMGLV